MTIGPTCPETVRTAAEQLVPVSVIARLRAGMAALFNSKSDRGRVQWNALFAFSVRVASAGLLYLSQIVLARWMGASEFGK